MKNNGGRVFPQTEYSDQSKQMGLTVRDYFAGQALMGFCANPAEANPLETAQLSFKYADAMLTERDK